MKHLQYGQQYANHQRKDKSCRLYSQGAFIIVEKRRHAHVKTMATSGQDRTQS